MQEWVFGFSLCLSVPHFKTDNSFHTEETDNPETTAAAHCLQRELQQSVTLLAKY